MRIPTWVLLILIITSKSFAQDPSSAGSAPINPTISAPVMEDLPPAPPSSEVTAEKPAPSIGKASKRSKNIRGRMESDLNEDRVYKIYEKYYSKPVSDEDWIRLLETKTEKTYKIQKGDTLWDLSTTLFGDAQYWPKMWSLNGVTIENPHQIAPGYEVQFTMGTLGEPPRLEVVKVDEKVEKEISLKLAENIKKMQTLDAPEEEVDLSKVKIPKTTLKTMTVRQVPTSVPFWKYRTDLPNAPDLEVVKLEKNGSSIPAQLDSFVALNVPSSKGEVVESEEDVEMTSLEDQIYVQLDGAEAGQDLRVYRLVDEFDAKGFFRNLKVVQNVGVIRVMNSVNSSKDIFRAQVITSYAEIKVGDFISDYGLPDPLNVTRGEENDKVEAIVVGGDGSKERHQFSEGSLIYLNAGSDESLGIGQTIKIYKNQDLRKKSTVLRQNPDIAGEAMILHVMDKTATALVTATKNEILIGDGTRAAVAR